MALFSVPIAGLPRISSPFGGRISPTAGASSDHKGIDYAVASGTPVQAAAAGTVIYAGWQSGFGNTVQIDHGGGYVTTYAHLSQVGVSMGQAVDAGAVVGLSGSSGTTTGPNLHFGITLNGQWVDPAGYLNGGVSQFPDLGDDPYSVVDLGSPDGVSAPLDAGSIDPGSVLWMALIAWAVIEVSSSGGN